MTHVQTIRRKAVWGPKRTGGALLVLILGLASSASTWSEARPTAKSLEPLPSVDLEFGDLVPLMPDPAAASQTAEGL